MVFRYHSWVSGADQRAPTDWGHMDQAAGTKPLKWYQGLDRYCWVVLIIAALGWLFDTMDQNLYNLVRAPSLRELLHPHPDQPTLTSEEKTALDKQVRDMGGVVTGIFIFGWATGPPGPHQDDDPHHSRLRRFHGRKRPCP